MPVRKLVRDKIPEILQREGKRFRIIGRLSNEELLNALIDKLKEEVEEFIKSRQVEELVDILEVVDAIAQRLGVDFNKLLELKERKRQERGGFQEGIIVELLD